MCHPMMNLLPHTLAIIDFFYSLNAAFFLTLKAEMFLCLEIVISTYEGISGWIYG